MLLKQNHSYDYAFDFFGNYNAMFATFGNLNYIVN